MGDKGDASKLGASQPALVIGGVNPSGRKKRASFPPSAKKLPPSQAAPTASNNNGGGSGGAHESHGLSDAEKAKIHGKINGAKALEASEKMRAYLENKARKQREAMERRYGVSSRSENGASSFGLQREASSVTLGVGAEVKRAAAIAVEAGIRACTPESSAMLAQGLDGGLDGLMLGGETSAMTIPRRIGAAPSSAAAAERSNSLATAPRTRVRSRACPRRGWRASAPPSGRDRPCPTERRRASERRRRRMANNDWTSEDPRPSRGRRRPARGPTTAHAAWRRRRRDTSKHERNTAPR